MKFRSFAIILSCFVAQIVSGQELLTVKCNLDVKPGTTIYVKGGITGSSSGQITNNGTIIIKQHYTVGSENWTNNSSVNFLDGTGAVKFNSGEEQYINGNYSTSFYNLTIDNSSSNGVLCGVNNNSVTSKLLLTNGALKLNHYTFVINNNSTSAAARTNGYIVSESEDSKLKWNVGTGTGNYIFPFGRYSSVLRYIPFEFNVTAAGTGLNGEITTATYHTGADNVALPSSVSNLDCGGTNNSMNVLDRYWMITPENYSSYPTATLKFNYEYVSALDNELHSPNTISESDLQAQRWDGTQWVNPSGGTVDLSNHYVLYSGISFNVPLVWVLVEKHNPLPVELLNFNVQCEDGKSILKWETASETNNSYFLIEKSKDVINWNEAGVVLGAGTINSTTQYVYIDDDDNNDIYYRLCQFDFDGKSEYLGIVLKNCDEDNYGKDMSVSLSPNPAFDIVNLKIGSIDYNGVAIIKFVTNLGQAVLNRNIFIEKGENDFQIDISGLNNEMYILKIETPEGDCILKTRLVVQR